ncbi:hypothetical protein D3C83_296630 [compost metagenome]
MVETSDAVAEFMRKVDHVGHFISAIAMVVHQDFAPQHTSECVEFQVTCGRRC